MVTRAVALGDALSLSTQGQNKYVWYPTAAQVEAGVTFGEENALTGTAGLSGVLRRFEMEATNAR